MEQKLYDAASKLPETALDFDAIQPTKNLKTTKKPWRAVSLAASIVLLICLCFGTYAVVAEAKEYHAAVHFFDEYDLSTEGLTRAQIKAVYRDITTKSFTYSKTAGVILRSLSAEEIEGYEIDQREPTPEDIKNIWNYKNYCSSIVAPESKIRYSDRSEIDEGDVFHGSYVEKYDGDTLVWSICITDFWVQDCVAVSDGVIAYGRTYGWTAALRFSTWIAKIDSNGNLLWKVQRNNSFSSESIWEVIENNDGSYAVFSRGDYHYLCLTQIAPDGTVIHFQKTQVGNYGIWNAARFGDGYILQLGNMSEFATIVKVNKMGNITGAFSYDSDDFNYSITNMIEFNGNIYLSAYTTPKLAENENTYGGRVKIARILEYIHDYTHSQKRIDIPSEELTPVVRDNYTAVLLVCNPNSGIPQEFYSVKGSLGGKLSLSDSGELLWDVESIVSTRYDPWSNFSTVRGTCHVYRYTFGSGGLLKSQGKTGYTTSYAG